MPGSGVFDLAYTFYISVHNATRSYTSGLACRISVDRLDLQVVIVYVGVSKTLCTCVQGRLA